MHADTNYGIYFGLSLFPKHFAVSPCLNWWWNLLPVSGNTSEFWSKLTRQVSQDMGPYRKQSEMQSILDLCMGKRKINGFGANLENIKLMWKKISNSAFFIFFKIIPRVVSFLLQYVIENRFLILELLVGSFYWLPLHCLK